ncbi:hypothetical protein [Hymenobacter defluvii]|uniref:Helix-turn-helix domain-containing protein n=1 Tax=Hymenobacter defluvii TaxID=2054411 RepID=A0ABS3TKE8_9BACT|nr:hypothetical protein [Hymenobacter defluvii]MBO3273195.1 hypothetical protein [Hymenobacter defluvii]
MMEAQEQKKLADLLPRGAMQRIADQLGIRKQAVSAAIKKSKPGHPAVVEAMRIARETGALETAKDLASLSV